MDRRTVRLAGRHAVTSLGVVGRRSSISSISAGRGIATLHMSREATMAPAALPRAAATAGIDAAVQPGREGGEERIARAEAADHLDRSIPRVAGGRSG